MSDIKDYSKLFEQAEKSVASVKDEGLRKIAFEKLLSHLLSDSSADNDDNEQPKRKRHKSKSSGQTSRESSKVKKDGPLTWLRELADEGFFKKPKSSAQIREELETRDHHLKPTDLTFPLRVLCKEKVLRRTKATSAEGGKSKLHWVKW